MNRNTKIQKVAFITGACAAAFFVVYGFLILLLVSNINKAVLVSGKTADETHKEENLRLLKNSIHNTENDRAEIAKHFVFGDGIVPFIEQAQSLGELSHARVTLRSMSVEGKANDMLKLEFSADGSFSEVVHFLTLAEYLPFRVLFEKVSMLELPKNKGANDWEAIATLDLLSFNGTASSSDKKIK